MWRRGVVVLLLSGATAVAAPPNPAPRGKIAALLRATPARAPRQQVYVRLSAATASAVSALRERGLAIDIVDEELGLVQGWVAPAELPALAAVPAVKAIRPADRAHTRTGRVTSQGDVAARADLVRAQGYDGAGVRVGVISDGIDGLARAQASGDLPAVTVPADARCRSGAGDEGTALLDVVHDLAPGAELLFSGAATSLEFIQAVRCMTDAGADVLVDDLGFLGEPFFQDGPVALAVRGAVGAGVSYVTAAGNDAQRHVSQTFRARVCGDLHDFGPPTFGCTNHVRVAPLETLDCTLQWTDPVGAAANDYDLLLVDASLATLSLSDDVQDGAGEPIEQVSWTNPGPDSQVVGLRIRKVRGEALLMKLICSGGALELYTPQGSIVGHAALPEVVTVGTVDVGDPGLDDVQRFSSRGPVQLFFPVTTRAKPDLVGFDGVTTAVPGFAPFSGTSAAAPHVAAAGALVLSKNPFLAPAQVLGALRAGAVDIGVPGFDDAAGAGRLDALGAANAVGAPACRTAGDCDPACPLDGCDGGVCTHSAVRGLVDGPCLGQRVPVRIASRFERACRLAARIPQATPRKAKKLGRRAASALGRAARAATHARGKRISPACAAALADALRSAAGRVAAP